MLQFNVCAVTLIMTDYQHILTHDNYLAGAKQLYN